MRECSEEDATEEESTSQPADSSTTRPPLTHISTAHLRGRSRNDSRRVHALLSRRHPPDDPGIQFGRYRLPSRLVAPGTWPLSAPPEAERPFSSGRCRLPCFLHSFGLFGSLNSSSNVATDYGLSAPVTPMRSTRRAAIVTATQIQYPANSIAPNGANRRRRWLASTVMLKAICETTPTLHTSRGTVGPDTSPICNV